MARYRRRRYSWALQLSNRDPEVKALSREGKVGLEYALALGRNARDRSQATIYRDPLPAKLTVEQLASRDFTTPIRVHTLIKQARIELFGRDLSDSAIYYRLSHRAERRNRVCAEPGCEIPIDITSQAACRYCWAHSRPAARVRRHRRAREAMSAAADD